MIFINPAYTKYILPILLLSFCIEELRSQDTQRDYGDAPSSYGNPSHVISGSLLGTAVDAESSGQHTDTADGDDSNGTDDEDGISFPVLTRGNTVSIPVAVTGFGLLNAWIDWNGDGDFSDGGERIAHDVPRTSGTSGLSVSIPANAVISRPTYARFRLGPSSNPTSNESYGEVEDYSITIICEPPQAPVVGSITQPTCNVPTGSVLLSGLPSSGTWRLTRSPGDVTSTGTGSSTTVSGLSPGTYTFTVENQQQCVSASSENVVINSVPSPPPAPVTGTITQPDCNTSTGSIVVNGLPSSGTWTLTRSPGNTTTTGTGVSTTISNLPAGSYTFTVENSGGCISDASGPAVINEAPESLTAPVTGSVTQPDCSVSTGSVVLSGLPSTGTWTLTRLPDNQTSSGTGSTTTITGLSAGTYTFRVGDASHCTSPSSASVVINQQPTTPSAPGVGTITQPTCAEATGRVVLNGLPSGSWIINPGSVTGSGSSETISGLVPGTYTFTVTNSAGCISPASGSVVINPQPIPPSAPVTSVDCSLGFNHAVVTVSSPAGEGMTYRLDNGTFQTQPVFNGVDNGNHTVTVRNSSGCTTTGAPFTVNCGCVNGPSLTLASTSGSTCSSSPLTVSGNTFAGSATSVSITENGAGTVSPSSQNSSPFSFTYTPASADAGNTVTITVRTNNPLGAPCEAATATYTLTVSEGPSAPVVGTITQPTCSIATGSVVLTGLPSGTWTLIRTPGDIQVTGSGTTRTITDLETGTYRFSIRDEKQCISSLSSSVVIADQPAIPASPEVGTITQPSCSVATGSVELSGLPSGTWTINPGSVRGSNRTTTLSGLTAGTYNFTVTSSAGCISAPSANVVINAQPPSPAAPSHSVDCTLGFNHAVITVTSPVGEGLTYRLNNGQYQSSPVFREIANGNYTITVRNSSGCTASGSTFAVACACVNGPSLVLSSQTGTTCSTTPVTVSGNTFGGNATAVSITENGSGSVTPGSANSSPFTFTYTPAAADAGRTVTITVSTNNPLGSPCVAASATYSLTVNSTPQAPLPGNIVQPSCSQPTGSVTLSRLPSSGTWSLTRSPDNIVVTGTGTSTVISGLNAGTYSFTSTSSAGCVSSASANVVINAPPVLPATPVTGVVSHPTCILSTGSVELSELPASGTWTVVTNPGGIRTTGTGTTARISGLVSGTYNFSVVNAAGCTSLASQNVIINEQPATPAAPLSGTVTQPGCTTSTGEIVLNGLPASGTWTLTRFPGTIVSTGTGTGTRISGLQPGTYNFIVTSEQGCTSAASANIVINAQPVTPAPPVVGNITAPTCPVPTGSVSLSGLPSTGTWTLTRQPGGTILTGTGGNTVVAGLETGIYTFNVTSSAGCVSPASAQVIIPQNPSAPVLSITDPVPVCAPATVDLTAASITANSTPGLTYTYWTDAAGTRAFASYKAAGNGTYYIRGTSALMCSDIKPVNVRVLPMPEASLITRDTILEYVFFSPIEARSPRQGEDGFWTVLAGSGRIADTRDPTTAVTGLSVGRNLLLWTVTNAACPDSYDTLSLTVHDLVVPTLLTPNSDGKNEYFILEGLLSQGKTELSVFGRSGERVFHSRNYDNRWNGVDYNGKPLPDGTYFFLVRSYDGKARTGFIVLRR